MLTKLRMKAKPARTALTLVRSSSLLTIVIVPSNSTEPSGQFKFFITRSTK